MLEIINKFSGKVRVRVCGVYRSEFGFLLLKHEGIGELNEWWSPPGGGVNFGETVEDALKREFQEETNLSVTSSDFLFVNEHIDSKHHAIELFFKVEIENQTLAKLGTDPELTENKQILTELSFKRPEEIMSMNPKHIHRIFSVCDKPDDIFSLSGFFKFEKN